MIASCLRSIAKECMRKVAEEERKLKGSNDSAGTEPVKCGVSWDESL